MKKKDTFIVIILGIITIAVIFAGVRYRQYKQAALLNESNYSEVNQSNNFETRNKDKKQETQARFLAAFDENRESKTVADFIQYVAYAKETAKVVFYGEIEEQAPWAINAMTQFKQQRDLQNVDTQFISTLGSEDGIAQNVEKLAEQTADVVFFHTPMPLYDYISWTEDGPVEKDNIKEIISTYAKMKELMPESLIVLVTPAPRDANPDLDEEESWHQVDIDQLMMQTETHAIPVYNLHNQLMDYVGLNNLTIADLYSENKLSDATTEVIAGTLLESLLSSEIDTTTAFIIDGEPAKVTIEIESESEEEPESVELEEEWYEEETEVEEWIEEEVEETYVPPLQTYTPPASSSSSSVQQSSSSIPESSSSSQPPASESETPAAEESVSESESSEQTSETEPSSSMESE